jgi:hypothetical protein
VGRHLALDMSPRDLVVMIIKEFLFFNGCAIAVILLVLITLAVITRVQNIVVTTILVFAVAVLILLWARFIVSYIVHKFFSD